jgi:tetratricopeptide (TPR) repeat protein
LRVSVLEHDGRLHDALTLAREVAARTDARSRHAADLEVARLAWRAGRTSEADAVLRQIEGARRGRHRREIDDARLLRASMALERGDTDEARRLLRAARERAETDGDDEMLAQVLRREGTLEARAGLPRPASGAYRAALVALRRVPIPRDPELEGILLSNLATTEGWQGRLDVAVELFERALARRGARPLASLNVRAARALLRGDSFRELFREAERLGDARLRAELGVYHAEECLFRGELARAEQSLIAVRVALAELGGHERILEALAAHAEACVRARRGRSAAREELLAAVEALAAHGARFHAARAARVAASVLAEIRATDAAVQAIARSAELADPVGIVLSTDATRHVVALAEAAASSHPRAHDHARAALESIGHIRAEAALRAAARSDLIPSLPRTSSESEALTWCIGPEGVHTISRVDRDALRRRTDSVVLDRELGVLFVHGTPSRSLGRMRHVEPLLAHLAARRPDMVSLDELARVVWRQRLGPSLRTAITTAVARARSLLGSARDVLITRGVADRRTYGLRADARFFRLDAGGSGPALGPEP